MREKKPANLRISLTLITKSTLQIYFLFQNTQKVFYFEIQIFYYDLT